MPTAGDRVDTEGSTLTDQGQWSLVERQFHINWLKLKAVMRCLEQFERIIASKEVLLKCDKCDNKCGSVIHQPGGRDKVPEAMLLSMGPLTLVSAKRRETEKSSHCRHRQSIGQFAEQDETVAFKMEVE